MFGKKRTKYWIATTWFSVGMLFFGIIQLLRVKGEVEFIMDLGYPEYLLPFLGISKILGVVILLLPGYKLLKEWAYAGFFFTLTGALFSHIADSSPGNQFYPPLLMLFLLALSWYFRPANRTFYQKPVTNNK